MEDVRRNHAPDAAVITTAAQSSADEFKHRQRRYAVMMSLRAVCVVMAALTYHVSLWLALAFVVGGAALPWCAVVLANDRPPKKRVPAPATARPVNTERAIEGTIDRTIDG